MKSTGIVRKVDEFGRIVIPVELRRKLEIDIKGTIEFFVDGQDVILRKGILGCSQCGRGGIVFELGNVMLCEACRDFCTGFGVGCFIGEADVSSFPSINKMGRESYHCNRK